MNLLFSFTWGLNTYSGSFSESYVSSSADSPLVLFDTSLLNFLFKPINYNTLIS